MVNKKDEEKEGKKENVGENGLRKRYEQEQGKKNNAWQNRLVKCG